MYFFLYSPLISNFFSLTSWHFSSLKPSNTGNIFLQLSRNFVALQVENVVGRITTYFKHCHATKFRCCKLKQHVASSWTGVYFFQQIFSTCNNKFCLRDNEVGGNTANNAFQLATQHCCVASCSNLLLVLLHLNFSEIFSVFHIAGKIYQHFGAIGCLMAEL